MVAVRKHRQIYILWNMRITQRSYDWFFGRCVALAIRDGGGIFGGAALPP
jgi:hypothetical protein